MPRKRRKEITDFPIIETDGSSTLNVKSIITWQVWECIKMGNKLSVYGMIPYMDAILQLETLAITKLGDKYETEKKEIYEIYEKEIKAYGEKINPNIKKSSLNKNMLKKIEFLERKRSIAHLRLLIKYLKIGGLWDEDEITETY